MMPVKSYGEPLQSLHAEKGCCLTSTQIITRRVASFFFVELKDIRELKEYLSFPLVCRDFYCVWNENLGTRCDLLDQALAETCEARAPMPHHLKREIFGNALAFSKMARPSSAPIVKSMIREVKESRVLNPRNLRLWRSGVPCNLCLLCGSVFLLIFECWAMTKGFGPEGNNVTKGLSALGMTLLVVAQIWPFYSLTRAVLRQCRESDAPPYEDCCAVVVLERCILPMRGPIRDGSRKADEMPLKEEERIEIEWIHGDYLNRLKQDPESYPINSDDEQI